ncbi:hypothetical protein F4X86_00505 [Candidatus Saccharibacteria bacterium]|nr:hypothetical protein [Candidatus Saccharibacteria bacterium]
MDKVFTHKAKISVGCCSFAFEGSREYTEKQVEKILAMVSKLSCAGPEFTDVKKRPAAKAGGKPAKS